MLHVTAKQHLIKDYHTYMSVKYTRRETLYWQQRETLFIFSVWPPHVCVCDVHKIICVWREECRKKDIQKSDSVNHSENKWRLPTPWVIYLSVNVSSNAHLSALFHPAARLLLICFFLFLLRDSPKVIFTWTSRKAWREHCCCCSRRVYANCSLE